MLSVHCLSFHGGSVATATAISPQLMQHIMHATFRWRACASARSGVCRTVQVPRRADQNVDAWHTPQTVGHAPGSALSQLERRPFCQHGVSVLGPPC